MTGPMPDKRSWQWSFWVALAWLSLSCSLLQSRNAPTPVNIITRTPLATFTSTLISGQPPAPGQAPPDVAPTVTRTPRPTFTPIGSPANVPDTGTPQAEVAPALPESNEGNWAFTNLRLFPGQEGVIIYGRLTNQSGQPQAITAIGGQFFDDQNRPIATGGNVYSGWPADVIPPDGQIPFMMSVDGVGAVGDYSLTVESEAAPTSPRQTFEFHEVQGSKDQEAYCLDGWLQNSGPPMVDYLIIVATVYDGQGNVIGFGDYFETQPEEIVGDERLEFAICLDIADPNVGRYDLQAWGE